MFNNASARASACRINYKLVERSKALASFGYSLSKMASEQSEIMKVVLRVALEELADSSEIDDSDPVYEHLVKNTSTMGPELLGTGRIRNYVEETVPTYSDPLFRAHFRMNRTSFQVINPLKS